MRARIAAVLSLLVLLFALFPSVGHAAMTLAQETETNEQETVNEQDETQQGEGGDLGEGEGQSDADAETGAGSGEQEAGESTEEEGPPWTYQMARIGLGLMLLVGLLMGLLYYRMIASRQRAA